MKNWGKFLLYFSSKVGRVLMIALKYFFATSRFAISFVTYSNHVNLVLHSRIWFFDPACLNVMIYFLRKLNYIGPHKFGSVFICEDFFFVMMCCSRWKFFNEVLVQDHYIKQQGILIFTIIFHSKDLVQVLIYFLVLKLLKFESSIKKFHRA